MRSPKTVRAAEEFGRARLSRSFFMRDFLYREISNVHGIPICLVIRIGNRSGQPLPGLCGRNSDDCGARPPDARHERVRNADTTTALQTHRYARHWTAAIREVAWCHGLHCHYIIRSPLG